MVFGLVQSDLRKKLEESMVSVRCVKWPKNWGPQCVVVNTNWAEAGLGGGFLGIHPLL